MSTPVLEPSAIVQPGMKIPDVLTRHPELRSVLDRYGLHGCGGPLGPNETLAYFARAHGVDEASLMAELREATGKPVPATVASSPAAAAAPEYEPGPADTIYRRFFKAGIAIVLSAGALWGAILLLRIGLSGAFEAISIHDVNAHGHAQIFGWIGLFVMGFAYQAFPRFLHTELPKPRLAIASFWLMVAGIAIRVATEPFAPGAPLLVGIGLFAGAMELAAVGIFASLILATAKKSGKKIEPYLGYAIAAIVFFVLQALGDVALFAATATAASADALGTIVSRYQPALRDVQIHGFALLMVLGVSQRFFPGMYGHPAVKRKTALFLLPILVGAVLVEVIAGIALRTGGGGFGSPPGVLFWGAGLVLAAAASVLVLKLDVLRSGPERDRSTKYYRAAYGWLLLSLLLLVAMPLYLGAVDRPSSHAYAGAVRHAITVGFLSLMILGVASKVVPTLCGVDSRKLDPLVAPFLLVNMGCAMRVGFQVMTDFRPEFAFPVAGVSGLLEVGGIGLWGIGLWRVMSQAKANQTAPAAPSEKPRKIEASTRVGPLVDAAPELLPVFLKYGFAPLANPVFRKTIGRGVTISQACAMHGVDAQTLLDELNAAFGIGIDPAMTVAEIARKFPATAPVFARHKIDACCGGSKALREVAEKHGLALEGLVAELAAAAAAPTAREPAG